MNCELSFWRFTGYVHLRWQGKPKKKEGRAMRGNVVAYADEAMEEDGPMMRDEEQWGNQTILLERAKKLLDEGLSIEQRQSLEEHGWFPVIGNLGHTYRIRTGQSANVDQVDADGKVIRTLCAAPPSVPTPDAMLAQKLLIEADELAFAFIARTQVPRSLRTPRIDPTLMQRIEEAVAVDRDMRDEEP